MSASDDEYEESVMKIYTKTGDNGTTSLYNGERQTKDSLHFGALGNVDELNSYIGLAREYCLIDDNGLADIFADIQGRLFDVGACVATPIDRSSEGKVAKVAFGPEHAQQLEKEIDKLTAKLPPLTKFILPSGGLASAHIHVARTICRRAERSVVSLMLRGEVSDTVVIYLNRLSDYLFTAARWAALKIGREEICYKF